MLIAGFALALYLPGSNWGTLRANRSEVTRGWGVDDETPLGTLSELSGIRQQQPVRNLGYPLMHPLMLGAVYGPYMAYLLTTGGLETPSDSYPYGLADPETSLATLALLGHLLPVLLAVGVVLAARDAGAQLGGVRGGVTAALSSALMFPMFYYSRTGNVDMPAARKGAVRDFLRLPALALLGSAAAFAVGSGLLIDAERFFAHVAFARDRLADVGSGAVWFMDSYPRTMRGDLELGAVTGGHLADSLTLPGLLLGVVGIILALRRSPRLAALTVPALTYLAVLFWSTRTSQIRYMMPVALVLAIFAGFATHAGLGSRRRIVRTGAAAVAVCALGLALLRGVDLTHAMLNDSRYAASEWLAENAPPAGALAYFGPSQMLPVIPSRLAIERANDYEGAVAAPRIGPDAVRRIEQRWRSDPPAVILLTPDHSSPEGVEHSASVPPEIFKSLEDGSLGFVRTEVFRTERLLPWLRRPALDYPVVNPPIRIYIPAERARVTTD